MLGIHLIANPQHPATKSVFRTAASIFPHLVALRSGRDDNIQHIYLLASHRPLDLNSAARVELDHCGFTGDEFYDIKPESKEILTDKNTNLDELSLDLAREHRRRSLRILGKLP